ncbi:MAG TPA: kelch repeat-containing protein [Acidobacteriaceae bacterium]
MTWSILEGTLGGSITNSGLYTAPLGTLGAIHVVATSVADSTVSATATLSVQAPPAAATNGGFFTAVGSMMTGRVAHTATLLKNGKVLIAGGWDGSHAVASAELYDPATRTFSATGSMMTARHSATATLLADGRVLIAGGNGDYTPGSYGPPIFSAEIYDPSTGAFTSTGNLDPNGGDLYSWHPDNLSTLLPDGKVFVAATDNAEIYDPEGGTFSLTGHYLSPARRFPNTVTLLPNGKVLFNDWSSTELFDPQTGTFSAAGPMTLGYAPSYGYTASLLADGRVFFLGSDDFPPADVEVYDPTTGKFTSVANTGAGYHELAPSSRLADGTVLIAGGQVAGGSGSTGAVLFEPASGTFEVPGPMTVARHSHKSTALPDGTVLITGGWSFWNWPNQQPTSTAEIYTPH